MFRTLRPWIGIYVQIKTPEGPAQYPTATAATYHHHIHYYGYFHDYTLHTTCYKLQNYTIHTYIHTYYYYCYDCHDYV